MISPDIAQEYAFFLTFARSGAGITILVILLVCSLHNLICKDFNASFRERLYNWFVFGTVGAALLNLNHGNAPHSFMTTFIVVQAVFHSWRILEKRFSKKR